MQRTIVCTSIQTGDTIANTSTKTAFSSAQLSIPATGISATAGNPSPEFTMAYEVALWGLMSTEATPGNFTIEIDWVTGAGPTLTTLGTTGAISTLSALLSGILWRLNGMVVFNSTGTSGIATFTGVFEILVSGAWVAFPMIAAAGSGTTNWASGFNTSSNQKNFISCYVTWATANSGNTIQLGGGSRISRVL